MGNGSVLLDEDVEVVCCQDIISHPSGNLPATVMFGYGPIPMEYARNNITLLNSSLSSTRPPGPVPMASCNGPHEPKHPSTRALDYASCRQYLCILAQKLTLT